MQDLTFKKRLITLQNELKAPKNLYNQFGKYKYRNAEGILEAVKPLLLKYEMHLTVSDDIVQIGERYYVKAIAKVTDALSVEFETASAYARESFEKKGQDDSQITGTASSYARKYALNGLFLLDDTKDADSDEYKQENDAKQEQKKGEEEHEKVANSKISKTKVDVLKKRCETELVPVEYILKSFKLERLEDMTEKQFSQTVNNWNVILEKTR